MSEERIRNSTASQYATPLEGSEWFNPHRGIKVRITQVRDISVSFCRITPRTRGRRVYLPISKFLQNYDPC